MVIGLHDADKNKFPNYALMKLSAWHKAQGDYVDWWMPIGTYDRVYSSKVFTFTPEEIMLPPDAIKSGMGYGKLDVLPDEIDRIFPDYSIYPYVDYAIGFLTRGCPNNCPWCIVPVKEGNIQPYRTWQEIKRPDKRDIVFMDNNVLACNHGIEQITDMIGKDVRIDFNQGLDARLIDNDVADILSRLKWIRQIRISCDTMPMLMVCLNAIDRMKCKGIKPYRIFTYLLVKDNIRDAEVRATTLRDAGVDVFAMPYRDFENKIEPTQEMKDFARWVNRKEIFKTVDNFKDYKPRKDYQS